MDKEYGRNKTGEFNLEIQTDSPYLNLWLGQEVRHSVLERKMPGVMGAVDVLLKTGRIVAQATTDGDICYVMPSARRETYAGTRHETLDEALMSRNE